MVFDRKAPSIVSGAAIVPQKVTMIIEPEVSDVSIAEAIQEGRNAAIEAFGDPIHKIPPFVCGVCNKVCKNALD